MPETSSIRSSVLVELRLVTDTDRHRQTQAHGQYRGCIASRGKNDGSLFALELCPKLRTESYKIFAQQVYRRCQ